MFAVKFFLSTALALALTLGALITITATAKAAPLGAVSIPVSSERVVDAGHVTKVHRRHRRGHRRHFHRRRGTIHLRLGRHGVVRYHHCRVRRVKIWSPRRQRFVWQQRRVCR